MVCPPSQFLFYIFVSPPIFYCYQPFCLFCEYFKLGFFELLVISIIPLFCALFSFLCFLLVYFVVLFLAFELRIVHLFFLLMKVFSDINFHLI